MTLAFVAAATAVILAQALSEQEGTTGKTERQNGRLEQLKSSSGGGGGGSYTASVSTLAELQADACKRQRTSVSITAYKKSQKDFRHLIKPVTLRRSRARSVYIAVL